MESKGGGRILPPPTEVIYETTVVYVIGCDANTLSVL